MRSWQIWQCPFPWGDHPAVVISNATRVARKDEIVVLACGTLQPATFWQPVETECLLDEADGMAWKTLCRYDLLYTVNKTILKHRWEKSPSSAGKTSRERFSKDWQLQGCKRAEAKTESWNEGAMEGVGKG